MLTLLTKGHRFISFTRSCFQGLLHDTRVHQRIEHYGLYYGSARRILDRLEDKEKEIPTVALLGAALL